MYSLRATQYNAHGLVFATSTGSHSHIRETRVSLPARQWNRIPGASINQICLRDTNIHINFFFFVFFFLQTDSMQRVDIEEAATHQ